MKKYQFRLKELLKLRRLQELAASAFFSQALGKKRSLEIERERLLFEKEAIMGTLDQKFDRGLYLSYMEGLEREVLVSDQSLKHLKERVMLSRIQLKEKIERRKMVEKIREKEYKQYRFKVNRDDS